METTGIGDHSMENEERFEPVAKQRPGDQVLRRRREPKRRLRVAPNIPAAFKFVKVIVTQTPFLPMFSALIVLWLLVSAGFYFAEHSANPEHVSSYGQALWWTMAAIETMGTPYKPVTTAGEVIGGIWAIFGVMLFWGMIVASVTVYFTRRREGTVKQIISTVTYNLEQLENLSSQELEVLKETTDRIIDAELIKHKEQS
jgi:voltage-gated potassium channel